MEWLIALALGYLFGSVPFGLILTRLTGAGDLRAIGSGNIGATNVLRTGRKGLAAATLLLDAGKGSAAVMLGRWFIAHQGANLGIEAACGLAALAGHCFPVWLGFKGGKGVATMLGVAVALDWRIGAASALAWVVVALFSRISSLGGMAGALAAPLAALVLAWLEPASDTFGNLGAIAFLIFAGFLATMAAIVIWRHRENIARLRAGTEPRVGAGRQA